ncbi:uncharacterized protein TM35_000371310 [Trypanosoma theileri]|uniref:Leishmanolysin-like peptidase n=1 Tax=Trypanosoma theileri TaxID=67003 RepID=A0A1X0NKW5_9TRYP|nr:uncharacterized protein TM35_000371310 [Trypanosoma theileri]ORC85158.1 hypothetical protein TM35_000371310 [Trypanosoma theileri]
MELEDGKSEYDHSHFNRCIARDELMSTWNLNEADSRTIGVISIKTRRKKNNNKARWEMGERMSWVNKSGSELLEKKCKDLDKTKSRAPFCEGWSERCTSDRTGVGGILPK